jgi:hypothetical protein
MTDKLRLRAYNVLFGDAFLLSIPDRDKKGHVVTRHLLIDIGNAWQDKAGGSKDAVFEPVVRDVAAVLDGSPLDLYIATHEHMDHVQGLRYVSTHTSPVLNIPIKKAWLTASAAPDYYDRFPDSEMKKAAVMLETIQTYGQALAASGQELPPHLRLLLDINDPNETDKCTLHILAQSAKKYFIHRDFPLSRKNPFKEVKFDIWAPEKDASIYYHAIHQIAAATTAATDGQAPGLKRIPPPPGVDASAFNNLLNIRSQDILETMLNIDKAANNTSIVFTLEWRGWKLLFAGDAEQRSWDVMEKENKLSAVDFIKISHHGSSTGTPPGRILEKIFPSPAPRKRLGLVSTFKGTYNDVPNDEALKRYSEFDVDLVSLDKKCADGEYIDILFPDGASAPEIEHST